MPRFIHDHLSLSATPVSSLSLEQLQAEREELLDSQVDPSLVPVGQYRLVVERAIQDRIFAINTAITHGNYQKEVR